MALRSPPRSTFWASGLPSSSDMSAGSSRIDCWNAAGSLADPSSARSRGSRFRPPAIPPPPREPPPPFPRSPPTPPRPREISAGVTAAGGDRFETVPPPTPGHPQTSPDHPRPSQLETNPTLQRPESRDRSPVQSSPDTVWTGLSGRQTPASGSPDTVWQTDSSLGESRLGVPSRADPQPTPPRLKALSSPRPRGIARGEE